MSTRVVITITDTGGGKMTAGVATETRKTGYTDNEQLVARWLMDKVNECIAKELKATRSIFINHKENCNVH